MKVQDPDGQTWRVTRRWFPWRLRWRDVDDNGDGFDLGDDLIISLLLLVLFLVLAPVVGPLILGSMELALILLVLPFAVLGRVLLGRKWSVEARRGYRPWHEETTGTWNDASVRISEICAAIERGDLPAPTLVERPPARGTS